MIRGILFTSEGPRHHSRGRSQESAPIPTVLRLSASNLIRGGSSRPWSGSDGASSAGASRPSGATTLPRRNTSRQGGRDWRKLHPRVDERGSIAARCSTEIPVDETSFFPHPPGQASNAVERQTVDSAYDNTPVHDMLAGRGAPVDAAPKKNAQVPRSGDTGGTRARRMIGGRLESARLGSVACVHGLIVERDNRDDRNCCQQSRRLAKVRLALPGPDGQMPAVITARRHQR